MIRSVIGVSSVCLSFLCLSTYGWAASSLSDPLTSFDGASFTVSAMDPIVYDAGGAHFGTGVAGDDGRSYQRTAETDYATVSFVAEITFETTSDDQQVFFGLGTGDRALFGTPDWSTQFSSASFWPETANDKFVRFKTANDVNSFADSTVDGFDPGVHRFRMTYDFGTKLLQGEIDINYAGGPFVADAAGSNFPIGATSLFAVDGWPSEPSSIFFGGDDGTTIRDFSVTVVPEPTSVALLIGGLAFVSFLHRR